MADAIFLAAVEHESQKLSTFETPCSLLLVKLDGKFARNYILIIRPRAFVNF